MGFWSGIMDYVDRQGSDHAAQVAAVNAAKAEAEKQSPVQADIAAKVSVPSATLGEQLPRNDTTSSGGAKYSAAVTPDGRVHVEHAERATGGPTLDIARQIMAQKSYDVDRNDPSFIHAPSEAQAFNIDNTNDSWGLGGRGGKALGGVLRSVGTALGGGLAGGKKGAFQNLQRLSTQRAEEEAIQQRQLADVSSNKTMVEAYNIAKMNYESDYNSGHTDKPFGDYLAQALEAMGMKTMYGGQLGTLIDIYGPEEAMRRMKDLRARSGGGGGGSSGYETRMGMDPVTGELVRRKIPLSTSPLIGNVTMTDSPKGITVKSTGRPKASSF